jgi:hypothetical protein
VVGQLGHRAMPRGVGKRTKWAQRPLATPLASFALLLYIFVKISCIQILFHVQVDLGEYKETLMHVMCFYLVFGWNVDGLTR